jgi:hypothetical protein
MHQFETVQCEFGPNYAACYGGTYYTDTPLAVSHLLQQKAAFRQAEFHRTLKVTLKCTRPRLFSMQPVLK